MKTPVAAKTSTHFVSKHKDGRQDSCGALNLIVSDELLDSIPLFQDSATSGKSVERFMKHTVGIKPVNFTGLHALKLTEISPLRTDNRHQRQ